MKFVWYTNIIDHSSQNCLFKQKAKCILDDPSSTSLFYGKEHYCICYFEDSSPRSTGTAIISTRSSPTLELRRTVRNHSFSTFTKFSEKLTFLTP